MHPRLANSGIDLRHFFNDKINDMRGVDQERARQDRIVRLDQRIMEVMILIYFCCNKRNLGKKKKSV